MAAQVLAEELLAEGHRVFFRGLCQTGAAPHLLAALDDPGGEVVLEGIGVDLEEPCLVLFEYEGEGIEGLAGAEPAEAALAPIDRRPEVLGAELAHAAVGAVGAEHQIGVAEGVEVRDLALEVELDAELAAPVVEDPEELAAREGGEPVTP